MKTVKAALAALAGLVLAAAAPPAAKPAPVAPAPPVPAPAPSARTYAAGQVWEYRTRPGEEASLLKIQRIETPPGLAELGPIYHISVVGLKLAPGILGTLSHAPVSRQTLDSSVTRLSGKRTHFPAADEGIEEWRRAEGGVFTISVAEIAQMPDRSTRNLPAREPEI